MCNRDENLYEKYSMPDGRELRIYNDESPDSPRTWDCNATKMLCMHKGYTLGDPHEIYAKECGSWDEIEEKINEELKPLVMQPIYMYDHSGITISTSRRGQYGDRWDSGQVGWVYITKEQLDKLGVAEEYRTEETLEKWLDEEIEQYDQYLTGDVYGFKIISFETCSLGHVHETEEDSCWGYYGTKFNENGLFEAAGYNPNTPLTADPATTEVKT